MFEMAISKPLNGQLPLFKIFHWSTRKTRTVLALVELEANACYFRIFFASVIIEYFPGNVLAPFQKNMLV